MPTIYGYDDGLEFSDLTDEELEMLYPQPEPEEIWSAEDLAWFASVQEAEGESDTDDTYDYE